MKKNIFYFLMGLFLTMNSVVLKADTTEKKHPSTIIGKTSDELLGQLVTPDFDQLPLKRKVFAYYLMQAIEAGRDITWKQLSPDGLDLRRYFEGLWMLSEKARHSSGIESYFSQLLAHHSNYDERKNEKRLLKGITYDDLMEIATEADLINKQNTGTNKYVQLEAARTFISETRRLQRVLFDPLYKKYYHAPKSDDEFHDLIGSSNTGFYGPGMTADDLSDDNAAPIAQNFLGYPYIDNKTKKIKERIHRINGRFSRELRAISFFLTKAIEFATPDEQGVLRAHIKAIYSGKTEDVIAAERLWVQLRSPDLEFIIGFIETYEDPMGVRGTWEGALLLKAQNPAIQERNRKIMEAFDQFEATTPYYPEYRKPPGSVAPEASSASLVFSGGGNGEYPFGGVNLSNWPEVQDAVGSKSFSMSNMNDDTEDETVGQHSSFDLNGSNASLKQKSFYLPEYLPLFNQFDIEDVRNLQVTFHEILGHGTGREIHGQIKPLGPIEMPVEETIAEVASLFQALNPLVHTFDILPAEWGNDNPYLLENIRNRFGITPETPPTPSHTTAEKYAQLMILDFFSAHLRSYIRLSPETTEIRQAHQLGRQVMLNWLHFSKKIDIIFENGVPKIQLGSLEEIQFVLGSLWKSLQHMKANGNQDVAKPFFEQWGKYTKQHQQFRRALEELYDRMEWPKQSTIYVNPKPVASLHDNEISEVRLQYQTHSFTRSDFINYQIERSLANQFLHKNKLYRQSKGRNQKPRPIVIPQIELHWVDSNESKDQNRMILPNGSRRCKATLKDSKD